MKLTRVDTAGRGNRDGVQPCCSLTTTLARRGMRACGPVLEPPGCNVQFSRAGMMQVRRVRGAFQKV